MILDQMCQANEQELFDRVAGVEQRAVVVCFGFLEVDWISNVVVLIVWPLLSTVNEERYISKAKSNKQYIFAQDQNEQCTSHFYHTNKC